MGAGQAGVDGLGGAGAERTHLHTRGDVQPVVRIARGTVTILIAKVCLCTLLDIL